MNKIGGNMTKLGKDLQVGDIVWWSPHMGGTVREITSPDGFGEKVKVIMIDGWGSGVSGEVYSDSLSPIKKDKLYHI